MELPEGVEGALLPAAGSPSGQALAAVVRLPGGREEPGSARLSARVGRMGMRGQMPLSRPGYVLDGPLGRRMAEELSAWGQAGRR